MPLKPKLRIAFLYDDSLDGLDGVAQYVKTLGGWLESRGHHVAYFVGQTKLKSWHGGKVYSLAKNLKVIFNGNRLSIPFPAKRAAIGRALAAERPNILHVQMPHSPLMSQRVINRAADSAVVGTFHIYPANWLARFGTSMLRYAYFGGLGKIVEIVSVSPAAQQFASSSFKIDSQVIPNMVDMARLKSSPRPAEPYSLVFLGRLVKRKGCRELIEAFSIVNQQLPASRLVIGGDGPERVQLEALVRRRGLSGRVEFRGFIDELDKPELLASAAIACFPSLYGESFGIVLIEAMAAGAGVVLAGDNPGYRSVMAEIPEALFNPRDPSQLAARVLRFFNEPQLVESVHQAQAELVKKFDVNNVGPQVEALYARAIDKAAKNRHN